MHQTQTKDVLLRAEYIDGPFQGPDGRSWQVLAEPIGRRPLKCFEVSVTDQRLVRITSGVVHNLYIEEKQFLVSEGKVWLTYTADFPVSTFALAGVPTTYRKPGPSAVRADVVFLPLDETPVYQNDPALPASLIHARLLGVVTRVGNKWQLTGGAGIFPVVLPALGGFFPTFIG